jgi:predicted dehydrogenase
MTYRMIHVGTGGWGAHWCEHYLAPSVAEGMIEVVAAVDIDRRALKNARLHLGLPPRRCYTDLDRALRENPADFCSIVVPPAHHEEVVDAALAHGLHILSEKPIADTLPAAARIAAKVSAAGRKMAVTMGHRFNAVHTTMREEIRSGRHGALDYLTFRFNIAGRRFGSFGRYRHEMADVLLIDGAVHHLDLLESYAGAQCDVVYAQTWNPPWGEYAGDSEGFITLNFGNGARALYEGSMTSANTHNGWGNEYVRAECRDATLVLDHRRVRRWGVSTSPWVEEKATRIPLQRRPRWAHRWIIEQFVDWLGGGPAPPTNSADNLRSLALVFAAIESNRTGAPVEPAKVLKRAQAEAASGNKRR